MEFMNTMIYNVLMALAVTLAGIIARQLLPYLREKKEEAIEKIRHTRWAWAAEIVDAVVRAIEQTVGDEIHGAEKKAEAVVLIDRILYQAGLHLSEDQIDALIEAAVQAMNANSLEVYSDEREESECAD